MRTNVSGAGRYASLFIYFPNPLQQLKGFVRLGTQFTPSGQTITKLSFETLNAGIGFLQEPILNDMA